MLTTLNAGLHGDRGLVVIGASVDRERLAAEGLLKDTPAHFDIVYDPDGSLAPRFQVPGMPSSFLIGRDGEIAGQPIGFRNNARQKREVSCGAWWPPRGPGPPSNNQVFEGDTT
jgi:hypothetical protein